jgi:hypothetical protein
MYNSSSGSKLNMGYRKNQRELAKASEEDSEEAGEESDEESEEEQVQKPKKKLKTTTKGRAKPRSSVGVKTPRPTPMDMTGDSSEETQAPPPKKPRMGKSARKEKAKGKSAKRRTLRISESPSKVKLGSTVVANSSLSQQQHTLSVAAMLRKKIAEFQVTTRPLFTYLLSESNAHSSLPVVPM